MPLERPADTAAVRPARRRAANPPVGKVGILVVGMHRSGTSAITRTLNLLGAALPGNLMPARPDNPAGFWESADIMACHDRFLAAVGSGWDDPLPLPAGAFSGLAAAACHDDLVAILHRDVADDPVFLVKDPRCCRLMPLWRKVLESFGAAPLAVLVVRNPLEAALSLRLRDGMPRDQALAMWLIHTLESERGTRTWKRLFVRYEDAVAEPVAASRTLAERLECFTAAAVAAALPEIGRFWSDGLRHHTLSDSAVDDAAVPLWVRHVHGWVSRAASGPEPSPDVLDTMAAALNHATEVYGPLVGVPAQARQAIRTLEDQRQEWHNQLRQDAEARATLDTGLRQAREDLVRLSGERTLLGDMLDCTRTEAAELAGRLAAQGGELQRARTEAAELAGRLAAQGGELQRARAEAAELAVEHANVQRALSLKQDEMARHDDDHLTATTALAARTAAVIGHLQRTETALAALAGIATNLHGMTPLAQRLGGLARAALRGRLGRRLAEDRDIAVVARSGLFDTAYYLGRYPDVATAGVDPIVHYVRCGAREGRSPHPDFDTGFYRSACPDLAGEEVNPLAHYARFGIAEGRRPNGGAEPATGGLDPLLAARLRGPGPDGDPTR
ncbi:MAG: hypothetical protein EPN20_05450 [Magnetospirillum sp.]|nr:MAG: hypothetical protein EPN20_05450 [Magnetospirillum sp.]